MAPPWQKEEADGGGGYFYTFDFCPASLTKIVVKLGEDTSLKIKV